MHVVKKYNTKAKFILKDLLGKKIKSISYEENIPVESNCFNFSFDSELELRIYSFMRVVQNKKVILCTNDTYIDRDFKKYFDKVKKQFANLILEKIKFTEIGDVFLYFSNEIVVQILIDDSICETDFFRLDSFSKHKGSYYEICRTDNELTIITGIDSDGVI